MYHANLVVSVAVALSGRHRQTKVYWAIRGSNMDLSDYGLALRLAEDDFVIAAAARYDPMKDYLTLLAALEQIPAARAIIMGAGTAVALPESLQLRVLVRHDNVLRVLGAADVPVSSPAYGVGFSNAIAEAMATGLPVVATDVGDAGRIVPPRDPDTLAAALADIMVLSDRAPLGLAARRRVVDLFALERAIEKFDILHRLGPDAPALQATTEGP